MPRGAEPLGLLAAAAVLAVQAGCGSNTDVSGKVTYKGQPVAGGSVTIVASDGQVYSATLTDEGMFTINAVPTGDAKVGVTSANMTGARPGGREGGAPAGGRGGPGGMGRGAENPAAAPPPQPPAPKGPAIPDKYRDPKSSGLTATIKSGQPVVIDLQ